MQTSILNMEQQRNSFGRPLPLPPNVTRREKLKETSCRIEMLFVFSMHWIRCPQIPKPDFIFPRSGEPPTSRSEPRLLLLLMHPNSMPRKMFSSPFMTMGMAATWFGTSLGSTFLSAAQFLDISSFDLDMRHTDWRLVFPLG